MAFDRPLPISEEWESPDAYLETLLSFSTTSVLFMNLCGGVHMVDFLTREPDLYTTILPEDWRYFFAQHDTQDIICLLLREDVESLRGVGGSSLDQSSRTWNGAAFPPSSLLEYIFNVRRLALKREVRDPSVERIELPKQVAMRMNKKKVHEVQCLSQHVAALSKTVHDLRGEPVSHIVDFGSGQNYLGRTLVSPPYHKNIIAIERTHQYISGAKNMDVRAKLAEDPKAQKFRKSKESCSGCDETPGVTFAETLTSAPPTIEGSRISESEDASLVDMLGGIKLQPDEMPSLAKSLVSKEPPKEEKNSGGTLSYVEHEIQDGYLEPIVDYIIRPPLAEASDNPGTPDEPTNARLMVVSLHSCGNLVHHGIRSLILNPSIVAVAMIGCCYNLLTERLGPTTCDLPILPSFHPRLEETGTSYDPHGFPMSRYYENYQSPGATTGMKLNITARALAVQAPYNWGLEDSEVSFTRHYFRALLERILMDHNILPKSAPESATTSEKSSGERNRPIIIGKLPKSAFKSFIAYVRAATAKMSRDPIHGPKIQENIATLTDEEIHSYETENPHARKNISILWSLMGFSAQLIEAIIVLDRWQFLREQESVKDCWVEAVFDYGMSPRNLAVIGLKK